MSTVISIAIAKQTSCASLSERTKHTRNKNLPQAVETIWLLLTGGHVLRRRLFWRDGQLGLASLGCDPDRVRQAAGQRDSEYQKTTFQDTVLPGFPTTSAPGFEVFSPPSYRPALHGILERRPSRNGGSLDSLRLLILRLDSHENILLLPGPPSPVRDESPPHSLFAP